MTNAYASFLASKRRAVESVGRQVGCGDVHPMLHDWQQEVVTWAVGKGRAALFQDCGLGKTFQQVEWARLSADTSRRVPRQAAPRADHRDLVRSGFTAGHREDRRWGSRPARSHLRLRPVPGRRHDPHGSAQSFSDGLRGSASRVSSRLLGGLSASLPLWLTT